MGVVPPFRPEIVAPDCPNSLIKVVNVCWQEEASKRPEFTKLKPVLRRISKGVSSSNFLDNLLKRMEQYSSNLERIVEEKTLLVVEEQAKTEEILYQIMPKFIALELKAGRPIPPELYESATVFVSDIVGFTVLSSMSSPLQVVNLLNDLYSIFDALINQFDAQKIETIGQLNVSLLSFINVHLCVHQGTRTWSPREFPFAMETCTPKRLPSWRLSCLRRWTSSRFDTSLRRSCVFALAFTVAPVRRASLASRCPSGLSLESVALYDAFIIFFFELIFLTIFVAYLFILQVTQSIRQPFSRAPVKH